MLWGFFNETVKEAVKGRRKVESMTYNISDDLENGVVKLVLLSFQIK